MISDRVKQYKIEREDYSKGPIYTPPIIAGILRAYDLPSAPEVKSPFNEESKSSLTAYPPQELTSTTFRDDLVRDWRLRQGNLVNRRVGYLFNLDTALWGQSQYLGVVIQYAEPNVELAKKYWNMSPRDESLNDLSAPELQKFYGKMEVVIIGRLSHNLTLLLRIKEALNTIHLRTPILEIVRNDSISKKSFPVVVINDLISLLGMNNTLSQAIHTLQIADSFQAKTFAKEHRKSCQHALTKSWCEHTNESWYNELRRELEEVRKHTKTPHDSIELPKDLGMVLEDLPLELLTYLLIFNDVKNHPDAIRQYLLPETKLVESKLINITEDSRIRTTVRLPKKFDESKLENTNFDGFMEGIGKENREKLNEVFRDGMAKFPGKSDFDIPQLVDEKLIKDPDKFFRELMKSEKEVQVDEKQNPLKKIQSTKKKKKKKQQPKTLISKKQHDLARAQERKQAAERKLKSSPSPVRQKFRLIQSQFQKIVKEADDEALIKQMSGLIDECQELDLTVDMNNFMADYYVMTAKNIYKRDVSNSEVNRRVVRAISFKVRALDHFNHLPEDDLTPIHQNFFEDMINFIENYLNDNIRRKQKEWEKVARRLLELAKTREPTKRRIGEVRWRNNPNPKNEVKKLLKRKSDLNFQLNELTKHLSLAESELTVENESKYKTEPQAIITDQFEKKIASGIEHFQNLIQGMIRDRMEEHKITQAPNNFFPREILYSVVKFMSIIKYSVPTRCGIYAVGGLILSLFQETHIGEQEFNFIDADLVTDVKSDFLIKIAKENGWNPEIIGIFPDFTVVRLYFEGVNFDVACHNHLYIFENRDERDINVNIIYLGVNKNLCPYLNDNNKIIPRLIDTQLLGVAHPGLIKACTGHFKNVPVTKVIPQWTSICQWIENSGLSPKFKKIDFLDLEHTLKNFIADPIRPWRLTFMLKKRMIKFSDFDYAMQLCFNFSNENFILAGIMGQYVIRRGPGVSTAIIFDKYLKYSIKKANQALDCTAEVNEAYRAKLSDIFFRMMQWGMEDKFFLQMFTFPLKMQIAERPYFEKIDNGCQQLFCQNSSQPPVYALLRKDLIEMYTPRGRVNLITRMMPIVLALVISIEGRIPGEGDFSLLLQSIIALLQKIPALQQLYLDFSIKQMPASIRKYLTSFLAAIKENQALSEIKEKAKPVKQPKPKISVTAYSDLSFLPPPSLIPGKTPDSDQQRTTGNSYRTKSCN